MSQRHYPGLPPGFTPADLLRWARQVSSGRINAVIPSVSLRANETTTTVTDPRLTGQSFIRWMPLTANAAAEEASMYVSARGDGTATITHANTADADKTFDLLVIG